MNSVNIEELHLLQDLCDKHIGTIIFHFYLWMTIGCRGRLSFVHRSLFDGDIPRFRFSYNTDGYVIFKDGGFDRVFIIQSTKDKDTVKQCAQVYHKMRTKRAKLHMKLVQEEEMNKYITKS